MPLTARVSKVQAPALRRGSLRRQSRGGVGPGGGSVQPQPAPMARQLLQVAVATLLVAGCPIAVVWWLRASGTVSSSAVGMGLGMLLSFGASYVGCLVWEKRPGSEDLLFSELMVWGYVHRWNTQRRIASALDMVGPMSAEKRRALDGLSTREQAKLLEQLVAGMETRDPYLHGHSRRVARHSWMIARRMGLPRAEVARIRTAAAIHDVGKVRTPMRILHKAGPLTDEEYEVIRRHPGDGASMAHSLRDPALTSIVRHHHERLDGTGYPDGLRGEEIPLGARIIAVADTFDAVTSKRPYRAASPHKRAMDILREEAGTRLDPAVVRAFCGHYRGRAPIALWSVLAGLPERAVSWLGGSLASVAAAAKVVAVAALVGGVAATSSVLGAPVGAHHHASSGMRSRAVTGAPGVLSGSSATAPSLGAPVAPVGARRGRAPYRRPGPKVHGGSTQAQRVGSPAAGGGVAQGAQANEAGPVSGAGEAQRGGEEGGRGGTPEARGRGEGSRGGEEPRTKAEEPHGKAEEPRAREEAPARPEAPRGNSEEAAVKPAEAQGKSEEPRQMPAKSSAQSTSGAHVGAPTGGRPERGASLVSQLRHPVAATSLRGPVEHAPQRPHEIHVAGVLPGIGG